MYKCWMSHWNRLGHGWTSKLCILDLSWTDRPYHSKSLKVTKFCSFNWPYIRFWYLPLDKQIYYFVSAWSKLLWSPLLKFNLISANHKISPDALRFKNSNQAVVQIVIMIPQYVNLYLLHFSKIVNILMAFTIYPWNFSPSAMLIVGFVSFERLWTWTLGNFWHLHQMQIYTQSSKLYNSLKKYKIHDKTSLSIATLGARPLVL